MVSSKSLLTLLSLTGLAVCAPAPQSGQAGSTKENPFPQGFKLQIGEIRGPFNADLASFISTNKINASTPLMPQNNVIGLGAPVIGSPGRTWLTLTTNLTNALVFKNVTTGAGGNGKPYLTASVNGKDQYVIVDTQLSVADPASGGLSQGTNGGLMFKNDGAGQDNKYELSWFQLNNLNYNICYTSAGNSSVQAFRSVSTPPPATSNCIVANRIIAYDATLATPPN